MPEPDDNKPKHLPFTSEYSAVHSSEAHPYEHVDQYSYGENGEKVEPEIHGIPVSENPGLRVLARDK